MRFPFVKAENRYTKIPEVGEICIIWDKGPRNGWRKGVILELIPSSDNEIRAAKVATKNGVLIRPLKLLFSLEMSESDTFKRSYHIKKAIDSDRMNPTQTQLSTMDTWTHDMEQLSTMDTGTNDMDSIGPDSNRDPVERLHLWHSAGRDERTAKLDAIGNITRILDYEKQKGKKGKNRRQQLNHSGCN